MKWFKVILLFLVNWIIYFCINVGEIFIIILSVNLFSKIRGKFVKLVIDKMIVIIYVIYRVWCFVKKIYLNWVKWVIKILNIIFVNIIIVVVELYVVKVIVIIVLLFGIILDKWKVCLNMVLNGFKEFCIIFVLLDIIKKLIKVLILFLIILGNFFFWRINFKIVIKVIKIVGVLIIFNMNFIMMLVF